jgi:hypothetical protein
MSGQLSITPLIGPVIVAVAHSAGR